MDGTRPQFVSERQWRRVSRRELLAFAPLAALAAFAAPTVRDTVIRRGLALTDRVSEWQFRPTLLAPTYADSDVTPFDGFPINRHVEFEPSPADLAKWRLYVDGQVSRPGRVYVRPDRAAAQDSAERPPYLHRGLGRDRHVRRRADG